MQGFNNQIVIMEIRMLEREYRWSLKKLLSFIKSRPNLQVHISPLSKNERISLLHWRGGMCVFKEA